MSFMQMLIYEKGALYAADCGKCGATHYAHEWTTDAFNDERDAMQAGTLRCNECGGSIDASTFITCKRSYAGRYSAPGYMDCTDWHYDANLRRLKKELRDMYGDEE
ncbi:MAG TPA: hypothetical protein VGU20_31195 [Stellaceae bacterium]|nr:hypothetical protein [Terriglobia bacterium]HEV2551818.1 hypothetical protein [Stellaceae bacterium]